MLRNEHQGRNQPAADKDRLVQGCERMLAREKAVELDEPGREEADTVHNFVSRDLHDAGRHLTTAGAGRLATLLRRSPLFPRPLPCAEH